MLKDIIEKAEKEYNGKVKYAFYCGSKSYGMTTWHDCDYLVVLDCDNFYTAFYKDGKDDVFVYSYSVFMQTLRFELQQSTGLHNFLLATWLRKKLKIVLSATSRNWIMTSRCTVQRQFWKQSTDVARKDTNGYTIPMRYCISCRTKAQPLQKSNCKQCKRAVRVSLTKLKSMRLNSH